MHEMAIKVFAIFLIHLVVLTYTTDLEDETTSLFLGETPNKIVIGAYGDYNADKLVDIFITSDQGRNLEILLAQDNKPYTRQHLLNITSRSSEIITSVMPADFNGDALMDILLTTKKKDNLEEESVQVLVSFGTDSDKQKKQGLGPLISITSARDQPTLFDYNQDMLPDFLIETKDKPSTLVIYEASSSDNFTKKAFPPNKTRPLLYPHSNAFIDVTQDYMADLFLTTDEGYQLWSNTYGDLEHNQTIPFPDACRGRICGQASFADTDRDGYTNLVVPVCLNETKDGQTRCIKSEIYGYSFGDEAKGWVKMMDGIKANDKMWNFRFSKQTTLLPALPITLRLGDYNMDGYPDALVFVQPEGKDENYAMLLQNVPCEGTENCFLNRTFSVDANSVLMSHKGAILGSFFDVYEDGVLDILLITMTEDMKSTSFPVLRALRQTSTTDTCFMKVTVTSGICYKSCPYGREPYGVNVPGPVVKFNTVSVNGEHQASSNTQLSQSAHLALQLPFVFFGLGQTPNFVDTVGVGIPVTRKTGAGLEHDWTQIIPNSQLVVIPFPKENPAKWILKLFVKPSQSILITGATLLGTCGFVAGIIGILHWRERREDMKEKRQESHKFHFDAM